MTTLDEALRALEKAVERMRHVLNDMRPISPCLTEQMEVLVDSASAAAALLTTRQEVAPVADGAALLVRDVCEMAPADPDAPDTVCIRVADLTRIAELYTTNGQTSDARDGAVTDEQCDAIYSALDRWARDVDSYDFGLPMVAGGGNVTAREVIRTAMQEAGKS